MNKKSVFKFRGLIWIIPWLLFMLSLHITLGGVWIARAPHIGGVIYLLISIPLTLFCTVLILRGRSDIVIDEHCIARCLFGRVWQRFEWANVELIIAFFIPDQHGTTRIRGINILPRKKPKFRIVKSGKMAFTDQAENSQELIDLVNFHAQKNHIPIKTRVSMLGELTPTDKI